MERGTHRRGVPERRNVLGLWLDSLTIEQTVARCVDAIEDGEYLTIGVVNAAKIVRMRRDARLRQAVLDCDLILADGQSVVWASRLAGQPLPERVAGIDLLQALLPEAARRGYRVYFLGARSDALQRMLDNVAADHPTLEVAGARDGYFSNAAAPAVAQEISDAKADLLFLGMSSPKKELFEGRWGPHTGAKVVHGVGGSFDVLAGEVRRAPEWWRRHGLEWLYRAIQEPLRLGPRYLTTNVQFIALVVAGILRRKLSRRRVPPPSVQQEG
jgi:N-acetylglucosaminyldiphosphoundecaprenol N-acetyl-beta-D-mannosaminyltransferase